MSALNSLPLPVVRLLAFFHEELSERRPGRVPQTVQLWVGCLLVILISMTFEIPFVALSLAVLFYGIQSNAFYTKFVAILFVVATVLEIGSLFLIYKWSYGEPLIRLIIAGPILMGCMFLMRTHRLGLVFFAVAIVAIYGQTFPAMLDYPEVVVRLTLWCIVVGLYPTLLMTLIGVLWFPSRAISQMHQALNDRLDDAISHLTDSLAPLPETRIEREALALQKLNVFCLADDANWRTQSAWWQSCVATVTYIYSTLNRYDPTSFADSQAIIEFRQKLASEINKLQHAITEGQCWQSDWRISESEARTLPQKLAGALGMLSKVMRIPRQQEVTALRTYLQIRIGLHAAFNACEEMCQRVALERQLDSEERALLIERSQTVIHQGRDLLHAWDATWNSAQALDNALQPDKAGQFADALEKYAAGLATALSRSPQITLEETPASQAILPTLLKQEQHVCQLFARLPDWTAPALTPATEQAQGATQ
ncbi:hypothetical protein CPO16_RS07495 [Escherichia coli]|nr:hypothetical protein [Escherichia coli]